MPPAFLMFIEEYGISFDLKISRFYQRPKGSTKQFRHRFKSMDEVILAIEKEAVANLNLMYTVTYEVFVFEHGKPKNQRAILLGEYPYLPDVMSLEEALKTIKYHIMKEVSPSNIGPKMRIMYEGRLSKGYQLPHYDNPTWIKINDRRNLPKSSRGFFQKVKEFFIR